MLIFANVVSRTAVNSGQVRINCYLNPKFQQQHHMITIELLLRWSYQCVKSRTRSPVGYRTNACGSPVT